MAVRRRIPKPVVAAAIKTAPRVAKTISRAARGAMPKGTSARVNPKAAKARAAQAKKADAAEGRRRSMAGVSMRKSDPRSYDTTALRRTQAIKYDKTQQKKLDRLKLKKTDKAEGRRRAMAAVSKKRNPSSKYKTPRQHSQWQGYEARRDYL